jgi:tryptophan-rich sensory protein
MGKKYLRIIFFLLIVFFINGIGAIFPPDAWYLELNKPSWTPPSWIFGPVWSFLYVTIAIVGEKCWQLRQSHKEIFNLWCAQLASNAIWSPLFFGLKSPVIALINILVLDLLVFYLIMKLYRLSNRYAYLLFPYFLWICFATILNAAISWLNF